MQGFTVIDLIILIVYLAAVLFAGLHFAKKDMKGKEYFKGDSPVCGSSLRKERNEGKRVFQGRRHRAVVGDFRIHLCDPVKPYFISVPCGQLLCRDLDYVVCTVGHAACHPADYQVFPADLQQTGY